MRDPTVEAYLTHDLAEAVKHLERPPAGADPLTMLQEVGKWSELLSSEYRYHNAPAEIRSAAYAWEAKQGGEDLWAADAPPIG